MTGNTTRVGAILIAILGAAALRLIPHPPNFAPIAAMALFSGAYMPRRAIGFAAPIAALLLSDLVLGFYRGMGFVYACMALVVLIGWWVSCEILARFPPGGLCQGVAGILIASL